LSISVSQDRVFEKGPRVFKNSDRNALEAALQAKEQTSGLVLDVFLFGNDTQEKILREALALGADQAHLVQEASLPSHSAGISWALCYLLKEAGPFDIVFMGGPSEDPPSSQIEFRLSEALSIPLIWNTDFSGIEGKRIKYLAGGENLSSEVPLLMTVRKDSNTPRIPNVMKIIKAARAPLVKWNLKEALEKSGVQLKGETLVRSVLTGK